VFGRSARKDILKKKSIMQTKLDSFYNMTPDTMFKFKGEKCWWQKTRKPFNSVDMCEYEWNGQKKLFLIG
jgi:hypothetical protein